MDSLVLNELKFVKVYSLIENQVLKKKNYEELYKQPEMTQRII